MRRTFVGIVLQWVGLAVATTGCATWPPYTHGALAHPTMTVNDVSTQVDARAHGAATTQLPLCATCN